MHVKSSPPKIPICFIIANPRTKHNHSRPEYTGRLHYVAFLHHAGLSEPPLVYAVEENGSFIGYVIYHAYDAESVEIGWVLLPEYWGRGYASALTDRLIDRARQAQKSVVLECGRTAAPDTA